MAWSRRWRVDSKEKWERVLRALLTFKMDFARQPVEIIAREELVEKTPDQRNLFHAICADLAPHLGLTPGQTKELVKREFYGVEVREMFGHRVEIIRSSEDSDRREYSRLIEHTYQLAAEQGIVLADRRSK